MTLRAANKRAPNLLTTIYRLAEIIFTSGRFSDTPLQAPFKERVGEPTGRVEGSRKDLVVRKTSCELSEIDYDLSTVFSTEIKISFEFLEGDVKSKEALNVLETPQTPSDTFSVYVFIHSFRSAHRGPFKGMQQLNWLYLSDDWLVCNSTGISWLKTSGTSLEKRSETFVDIRATGIYKL